MKLQQRNVFKLSKVGNIHKKIKNKEMICFLKNIFELDNRFMLIKI